MKFKDIFVCPGSVPKGKKFVDDGSEHEDGHVECLHMRRVENISLAIFQSGKSVMLCCYDAMIRAKGKD